MDCADCALSLERSLAQIKGVEQVNVNYTTGFMEANGSFDPQELIKRVEALGYKVAVPGQSADKEQAARLLKALLPIRLPGFLGYLYASKQTRLALLGAILLMLSIPFAWSRVRSKPLDQDRPCKSPPPVLAGYPIANRGMTALVIGRQITIDLLMSIATLGALVDRSNGRSLYGDPAVCHW